MKKVVLIHGFTGSPNGGWRPWLMGELDKMGIYSVSLPMPSPDKPMLSEWISTIKNFVDQNLNDEIYLVGHSLGGTTILRYLELYKKTFPGIILVSSPCEDLNREGVSGFLEDSFDFTKIKNGSKSFTIIHGDNDDRVPLSHAERLSRELDAKLIIVKNGGHLNGRSGWTTLPQCLKKLEELLKN